LKTFLTKLAEDNGKLNIESMWDMNIMGNIKLSDVVEKGVKIISVIILMYFSIRIGKYLIKKFVEKQVHSSAMLSLDSQRAKTLGEVLKSVLKYSVYFMGTAIIISILFSEISLTFASIGGIAVGLGAQSLIKDIINGFFILFENQFGVGDHVTIGNLNGVVKSIGIRTTVIIDFTGDVHFISNGTINSITNHSRNDIRFTVDVNISYKQDIERVIDVIKVTCEDFKAKNEEYISDPIEVSGIKELGVSNVTIRVVGKAKPLNQGKMENELRKVIKLALDKNKVEMPSENTEIENKNIEMSDRSGRKF
jgi:small-conductance mechanosensitive channel